MLPLVAIAMQGTWYGMIHCDASVPGWPGMACTGFHCSSDPVARYRRKRPIEEVVTVMPRGARIIEEDSVER